jgi:ABC-type sugar transport system ATPase subunit
MINVTGLSAGFRNFALDNINLTVEHGDYFMLVGPTGAGKTLLLECIAGLHRIKSGRITFDGREVTGLEPEKRNIGMVHQDGVLFPHLAVKENIIFGLKVRHTASERIKQELAEAVELVKINHLLERKPGKLSGGEKQKVALARALVIKPGLLLLDEPLSALDPGSREALQVELKHIHQQLGITTIHVTHDFDEAMMLGRHIAVIGEGRIQQIGTPEEIFHHPASEFVARFTMMRNILAGETVQQEKNLAVFRAGKMSLEIAKPKQGGKLACIRPEDIAISVDTAIPAKSNSIQANITRIEDRGSAYHIFVDGPPEICCLVPRRKFMEMGLTVGKPVWIILPADAIHVI